MNKSQVILRIPVWTILLHQFINPFELRSLLICIIFSQFLTSFNVSLRHWVLKLLPLVKLYLNVRILQIVNEIWSISQLNINVWWAMRWSSMENLSNSLWWLLLELFLSPCLVWGFIIKFINWLGCLSF